MRWAGCTLITSIAILSCANSEPPDVPPTRPLPSGDEREPRYTIVDEAQAADVIEERREARERSTITVMNALLREVREDAGETDLSLVVGTALLEMDQGRIDLRLTVDLERGTYYVYLLEPVITCAEVNPESHRLFGPPDPLRPDYLGTIEATGREKAVFEHRLPNGIETYESKKGRPLVLVRARGKNMLCGEFRESSGYVPVDRVTS